MASSGPHQQRGRWEEEGDEKQQFMIRLRLVEGRKREARRVSEMGWGRRGWTGIQWGGRHVGCPELPDGSEWLSQHCTRSLPIYHYHGSMYVCEMK